MIPDLMQVRDGAPLVSDTEDHEIAGLVASAIARLVGDPEVADRLRPPSRGSLSRTYEFPLSGASVSVILSVPAAAGDLPDSVPNLVAEIRRVGDRRTLWRSTLEGELLDRFRASKESRATGHDAVHVGLLMELAHDVAEGGLASFDVASLEALLFETVPRKVSESADAAPGIVEDCRAFYAWLVREQVPPPADACLARLDDRAALQLEAEMVNPANFGPAKSVVMRGIAGGHDMGTPEGVQRFVDELRMSGGFGASLNDVDATPHVTKPVDAAKRKDRRKARKRNRKR